MPLQSVNSPNLSLLREFHFSTTVQAAFQKLMGQVAPPVHWECRIDVTADPFRMQTLLRLNIYVKDHQRLFQIGGESWSEPIFGHVAGAEEPVNDMKLVELGPRERAMWVAQTIQALFFRVKTGLYEFDPRIGHCPSRDGPLPACPLLDPGEPLSRTGGFHPKLFETYPNLINHERVIGTHCPLCDGEIDGSQEFLWGGANMLWVHTDCWRAA